MNGSLYAGLLGITSFGRGYRAWTGRPWSSLAALMRQRRDLSRLDDRMLRDIGVTRDEAHEEAERPVWDVPDYWR